MVALVHRNNHS